MELAKSGRFLVLPENGTNGSRSPFLPVAWGSHGRAGRQRRAGPEPSLRLARFRDVLAAGRVHLETVTSKEHVDRGTNLVHKCVGELTAAGHGCALGSTLNPQKAGERPGLQQGGDVLNETCDATLVIWVGAISKCESFQNKPKAATGHHVGGGRERGGGRRGCGQLGAGGGFLSRV